MSKKLVEREHLNYILEELFEIQLYAPLQLQDRIAKLYKFIDQTVIDSNKENINELKRAYYADIKNAKSDEEKQRYYKRYKSLDEFHEKLEKISNEEQP